MNQDKKRQKPTSFDIHRKFPTSDGKDRVFSVQTTAGTENLFPMIAPGLPEEWDKMELDQYDLFEP